MREEKAMQLDDRVRVPRPNVAALRRGIHTHPELGFAEALETVAAGKLASLVVWDKDPLRLGAFPSMVMGEGRVLRWRP